MSSRRCVLWATVGPASAWFWWWNTNYPPAIDLINDVLLAENGSWIIAAAASTSVPPPYHTCVNLTVTKMTNVSSCIVSNLNLTVRNVTMVQMVGWNEYGHREVNTQGPVHQYMIKRRRKDQYYQDIYKKEMDWETALNQPLCWSTDLVRRGKRFRHKFVPYRYMVMPAATGTDFIYMVGIKERSPVPEYEVALLSRGIKLRKDVLFYADVLSWKNYDNTGGCYENIMPWEQDRVNTKNEHWKYFLYCLPRLHIKCAKGYNLHNDRDPINQVTFEDVFKNYRWAKYYYSSETTSIYVAHD